MEICNGCTELTDLDQLFQRIEQQGVERKRMGKAPHPIPTTLVNTLKKGLPPSAGVAVGLNRLFKCLNQD